MLIFVYGENTFLSLQHFQQLRDEFVRKHDPSRMNVDTFNVGAAIGKEAKEMRGRVASALSAPAFLGNKRMVLIKALCETVTKKAQAEPWISLFESVPQDTILVLHDQVSVKAMKRHAIFKAFSGTDGVFEYPFPAFSKQELDDWALAYTKSLGMNIDRAMLRVVLRRSSDNVWQLAQDMKKLADYTNGAPITQEDVELLVRQQSEDQMFALMDALSTGNTNRALELLEQQRQFGTSNGQIFAMLARQIRLLLSVKSFIEEYPSATKQEVAKQLSIHPYVAQKTIAQAGRMDKTMLARIQMVLYRLDSLRKIGVIDDAMIVDRSVFAMTQIG